MTDATRPPFEVKTIPGPTAEERAAKQRKADRMLTKARRTYRISAKERHATRRYLRSIAEKGNRPWFATRSGFRAHLAVSPMTLTTFCFHRCRETTTGEPTAPLGMCRTCLRRWNRAVADAKTVHSPHAVTWFTHGQEHEVIACRGCHIANEHETNDKPRSIESIVKDGDADLLPLWPCAHADETDPLAGPDDPQTWRALTEHRETRKREKQAARKPITDDEY